jgi:predicted dinucleotide-binding enzyme
LNGKLIIDAMNYWWEVDGPRKAIMSDSLSSSEAVQSFLDTSRVVKAFSHIGYHELHDDNRPAGDPQRKAIAIAGDQPDDVETVSKIVDDLGFDPLAIGNLSEGIVLEPGHPGFGTSVEKKILSKIIDLK